MTGRAGPVAARPPAPPRNELPDRRRSCEGATDDSPMDTSLFGIDSHGAEDEGEGNATYTRQLISALFRGPDGDDFALFARNPAHPFYRTLPPRGRSRVARTAQGKGVGRVGWALARAAAAARVDALHVQYFA